MKIKCLNRHKSLKVLLGGLSRATGSLSQSVAICRVLVIGPPGKGIYLVRYGRDRVRRPIEKIRDVVTSAMRHRLAPVVTLLKLTWRTF
jgi:hypothetical protein